uniref:50S ribosomal protein L29 n=1 Tax=Strongyloides venezuelensis TaxID=75913 RepID=A0A0K0FFQ5_STRVS
MDDKKFEKLVRLKQENIKKLENISSKLYNIDFLTVETRKQGEYLKSLGILIETSIKNSVINISDSTDSPVEPKK